MQETVPTPLERCADPLCGAEFSPHRPGHKYHSPRCRKRHWEASHGRGRPAAPGPHLACPHCGTQLALALQPAPHLPVIPNP